MKITGRGLFHGRYLLMLMDVYQGEIFEVLVVQDLVVPNSYNAFSSAAHCELAIMSIFPKNQFLGEYVNQFCLMMSN